MIFHIERGDWMLVEKDGKRGVVPKAFCEKVPKKVEQKIEVSPEMPKKITYRPRRAKANFKYVGEDDSEASFDAGDIVTVLDETTHDMWLVECDGHKGHAPSIYLDFI
eukprot:CAMPEP_0168509646 /NCGR_PEP_ID=MMETSP0405-20121227/920_1 /TAXON_ID=498012 /ORGANISM="Trichosphaerium sp, Strain Am-I-7 wt" /LENGTH=107 /DNA_ID=CAMNT_0008527185 /DNA_START=360 /DNA_END=683 /DNA_ORIENTATION=-